MSAIEPPSLWPTSTGRSIPSVARAAPGSTSSASSCMKRGVRGASGTVGLPVAGARVEQRAAAGRRPPAAPGSRATARPSPSPSCRNTSAGSAPGDLRPRAPRVTAPPAMPPLAACSPPARPARAPTARRRASPSSRIAASRVAQPSVGQAAGAEADVPALVAQHQLDALRAGPAAGRRRGLEQRDWPAVKTTPSRTMW